VSPELLFNQEAECPVDLWALGIIVYQMLTGTTPFKAANEFLIFEKIRAGTVEYPEDMDSVAKDFI
jgi:3-phosphoinositide dependent protein kinase-1